VTRLNKNKGKIPALKKRGGGSGGVPKKHNYSSAARLGKEGALDFSESSETATHTQEDEPYTEGSHMDYYGVIPGSEKAPLKPARNTTAALVSK
jgi:hypothetical protein